MDCHAIHTRRQLAPVLAAVLLAATAGCTAPTRLPPAVEPPPAAADAPRLPQRIADGRWELIESNFASGAQSPGARRPTMEFKAGRLAAYSGCNRASGDAIEAEGRMVVGLLAATRMACAEPLASFEQRFFKLIQSEPLLRIEGRSLTLIAGNDNARFRRADDGAGGGP
jgi:heat shock protein HslJ